MTEESLTPADSGVELETPFEDTHFGTRMAAVRDPDGPAGGLQAPASAGDQTDIPCRSTEFVTIAT